MLKKLAILCSLCALGMIFNLSFKTMPIHEKSKVAKGWKKYSKVNNKITSSIVIKKDLEKEKLVQKRAPSSISKRKLPMRNGRFLDGINAKSFTDMTISLKYKNKVDPNWQEKLGHGLTQIHKEGTEVLILKERPVLYIKKGVAEYREQVSINFKLADGGKSSYRAMVDSSTGRIIYTYDRTKMEYFRNKPTGMTHPLAN
jgi:hypothetical protein